MLEASVVESEDDDEEDDADDDGGLAERKANVVFGRDGFGGLGGSVT